MIYGNFVFYIILSINYNNLKLYKLITKRKRDFHKLRTSAYLFMDLCCILNSYQFFIYIFKLSRFHILPIIEDFLITVPFLNNQFEQIIIIVHIILKCNQWITLIITIKLHYTIISFAKKKTIKKIINKINT
jgi:hypothetical protein